MGWNRGSALFSVGILLLSFFTFSAQSSVEYSPVQPTHEDNITLTYSPSPEDNTTVVRLLLNVNNTTSQDIDLAHYWNNVTKTYSYDLGVRPAGTTMEYSVVAWNRTADDGNISVASVVNVLWHSDIQAAITLAKAMHRPMLMLFWSEGDRSSYDLLTEGFSDERVLNLTASFVCVKVRVDSEPDLAREWNVSLERTPIIVFLDNRTLEVHRAVGQMSSEQLLAHMHYSLGTGPRPKDPARGFLSIQIKNLIIVIFLLLLIIAVIFVKARWGYKRNL